MFITFSLHHQNWLLYTRKHITELIKLEHINKVVTWYFYLKIYLGKTVYCSIESKKPWPGLWFTKRDLFLWLAQKRQVYGLIIRCMMSGKIRVNKPRGASSTSLSSTSTIFFIFTRQAHKLLFMLKIFIACHAQGCVTCF